MTHPNGPTRSKSMPHSNCSCTLEGNAHYSTACSACSSQNKTAFQTGRSWLFSTLRNKTSVCASLRCAGTMQGKVFRKLVNGCFLQTDHSCLRKDLWTGPRDKGSESGSELTLGPGVWHRAVFAEVTNGITAWLLKNPADLRTSTDFP